MSWAAPLAFPLRNKLRLLEQESCTKESILGQGGMFYVALIRMRYLPFIRPHDGSVDHSPQCCQPFLLLLADSFDFVALFFHLHDFWDHKFSFLIALDHNMGADLLWKLALSRSSSPRISWWFRLEMAWSTSFDASRLRSVQTLALVFWTDGSGESLSLKSSGWWI